MAHTPNTMSSDSDSEDGLAESEEYIRTEIERFKAEDSGVSGLARGNNQLVYDSSTIRKEQDSSKEYEKKMALLQKGMEVTYDNFAKAKKDGARSGISKREHVMTDISGLLPPGYNPKLESHGHMNKKLRLPKPPPGSKQKRSTQRPVKNASLVTSRQNSKISVGEMSGRDVSSSRPHSKAPSVADLSEGSVVASVNSGNQSPVEGAANNDDGYTGEEEEELDIKIDYLALQQEEEGKKMAHMIMEKEKVLTLVKHVFACDFLVKVFPKYRALRHMHHSAAIRLQYFHRMHVVRFVKKKHWSRVGWPMLFIIKTRLLQKRIAAKKIATFVQECQHIPYVSIMKSFFNRIRKCNFLVRGFVSVNRARGILINKYWIKTEEKIRKKLAVKEAKRAAQLKKEQTERMLANAARSAKRGKPGVHAQWLEKEIEVKTMLMRSDIVQQQYRVSVSKAAAAIHETDHAADGGVGDELNDNSGSPAKKTEIINFDKIDDDKRLDVIKHMITSKRRTHIRNIVAEDNERARTRGVVSESAALKFIKAQGAKSAAASEEINNIMTAGLNYIGDSTAADYDRHRSFLCLRDTNLGDSWYNIIEREVLEDIERKKSL